MPSQVTFYPVIGDVSNTAWDGYVSRETVEETWASIVAGNGNAGDRLTYIWTGFQPHATTDRWTLLWRGIIKFDCSSIPDDATILSATLYVWGYSKQDYLSVTPNINVYSAASTPLYETCGTTPFSTAISYNGFSITGYNAFILNAAGIANISKTATKTAFSLRNANYDVAGISPTWANQPSGSYIACYAAETDAKKPYLVVTYTTGTTSNQIVTGLRHIYNRRRDDLEITFGGYSTAEDLIAPEIMKIVDDATIPQIPPKEKIKWTVPTEPPKLPPLK